MSPEWGLREGACPSQPEQREEGFEVPACLLQVTGPHSGLWVYSLPSPFQPRLEHVVSSLLRLPGG